MMFTSQDVTAYVPCFNAGATLPDCLAGLAAQTAPPAAVLLVDDGSDPAVRAPGLRVVRHPANAGLAAARNTALRLCQTPLLAALDADVVAQPDWLERLLEALNRTGAAGVGGRLDEHVDATLGDQWRAAHMAQHWGDQPLLNPRFLYGANTLFQVERLRAVNGYDPELRTNNEDRTVCEALYARGDCLYYTPQAQCRHLRRDTCRTILQGYWRWHYAAGLKQGDFDRPAGLLGRISLVNFGIYRYRLDLDQKAGRPHLLGLDAALPWVFCALDLAFYARRAGIPLPRFPADALWGRLPEPVAGVLRALVPTPAPAEAEPIWMPDYRAAFEECLGRFNWWTDCGQAPVWHDLSAAVQAGVPGDQPCA